MPRASVPPFETIAELLEQLGDIDPRRIRTQPPPGKATERDLVHLHQRTSRLFELVDGVLVEKVMSYPESNLACDLIWLLRTFLEQCDLGILAGESGAMRLMPGLVRVPDVSFVSWDRLPARGVYPSDPVAGLAPDLAVEVLSEGNTKKEMQRKLKEYFLAGVRLVWFVDPKKRTVEVFTAPDRSVVLAEEQTLDGGDVLPGLKLPLKQVFARVARPAKPTGKRRKGSHQG